MTLTQHSCGEIWAGIFAFSNDTLSCDPHVAVPCQTSFSSPLHDLTALLSSGIEQQDACFGQLQLSQVFPRRHFNFHLNPEAGTLKNRHCLAAQNVTTTKKKVFFSRVILVLYFLVCKKKAGRLWRRIKNRRRLIR